jgi:hypothetical protein
VHTFVRARQFERSRIPSDHHVPQRDRVSATGQRSERRERPVKQWTVGFDNAVDYRNSAAPQ